MHKYTYFEKLLSNVEATFTFVQAGETAGATACHCWCQVFLRLAMFALTIIDPLSIPGGEHWTTTVEGHRRVQGGAELVVYKGHQRSSKVNRFCLEARCVMRFG